MKLSDLINSLPPPLQEIMEEVERGSQSDAAGYLALMLTLYQQSSDAKDILQSLLDEEVNAENDYQTLLESVQAQRQQFAKTLYSLNKELSSLRDLITAQYNVEPPADPSLATYDDIAPLLENAKNVNASLSEIRADLAKVAKAVDGMQSNYVSTPTTEPQMLSVSSSKNHWLSFGRDSRTAGVVFIVVIVVLSIVFVLGFHHSATPGLVQAPTTTTVISRAPSG